MKFILSLFIALFSAGCVMTPPVEEAEGEAPINTLSMSCKKPYLLTQDCSIWAGAKRSISIEGFEVKVAASEDGSQILVMDAKLLKNTFSDFYLNSPTHSKASNDSYHAIRSLLDKAGVEVKKVRPLKFLGNIDGYVLLADGDGYAVLTAHDGQ